MRDTRGDVAAALAKGEGPCPTFSESAHDADECKHCSWTEEAHYEAAVQRLRRDGKA